jgi:hypothetical protein
MLFKKTAVCDWYNCFKSRQELLADKPRSQKPSNSVNAETISKTMVLMCAYQQITISEVMNEVGHLDQQRQF